MKKYSKIFCFVNLSRNNPLMLKGLKSVNLKIIQMYNFLLKWKRYTICTNWWDSNFFEWDSHFFQWDSYFLYPATKVWRGIMLYPLVSVRPSVRAHHFRSITWVFIHGIFSNFAYILLSAMSGMGLLMGKIRPFLTELLPFFVLEKWFLACYSFTVHDIWMKLHRYVAHQMLHIVTKDRHSDLPSLWVIRPW